MQGINKLSLALSYFLSFIFFRGTDDLKDAATPRAIQLTSHVGRPPNGEVVAKEGSEAGAERGKGGSAQWGPCGLPVRQLINYTIRTCIHREL